jgi:hypothetical protein
VPYHYSYLPYLVVNCDLIIAGAGGRRDVERSFQAATVDAWFSRKLPLLKVNEDSVE